MNKILKEDMKELFDRGIDWPLLYNSSVLITGAYGMLASCITFMLIYLNEEHNAGIEIYAVGRNKNKAQKRFGTYYGAPYFHFVESDLSSAFSRNISPKYIIHSASYASSNFFAETPVDTTIPNVIGTYNILDMASRVHSKSILFVSSGEVYGRTNCDTIYEDGYGISDPLDVRYCYGESKRMGECLCNCYYHQYGVPVKIARLGHTFGPTMDIVNDKRVFSEFVGNVVRGENIMIKSDGSPMRAFCYSADAVAAFFKILLDGQNGEAYNIANMKGLISMRNLAEMLVSLFPEKGIKTTFIKRNTDDTYIESSMKKHNVPNTEKLQALGWECRYSVKDGFYRTIISFDDANNSQR